MAKKIIVIATIIVVSVLGALLFFSAPSVDKNALSETFFVEAIYYPDQDHVEITFEDKSEKSSKIILEILGMSESFQKQYDTPKFVERVNFSNPPKYGWQIHPVTFVIEHPEFGKIGLKTEIHLIEDPTPSVIYSAITS